MGAAWAWVAAEVVAASGDGEPPVPWHRAQEAAAKAAAFAAQGRLPALAADGAASLPIDATFFDLHLDFDPATRILTGDVALEARVGASARASILLDFDDDMVVDSVRVDGAPATFSHLGDDLTVQLGRTYAAGEPFRVEVSYAGTPGPSSALHFDTRLGQPLIWTLSEPYGARTWWPCQDTPADKADSAHVDLTVPSALTAVGNGWLDGTSTAGGKTTFRWRERRPITPYLISIAAHPYTMLATSYTPLAGGSMPVTRPELRGRVPGTGGRA